MKRITTVFIFLFIAVIVFAQDTAGITAEWLENINNQIYSALVIIIGLVSNSIPGLKRFSPLTRVVAIGLSLGIGFFTFGGSSVLELLISYAFSNSIYDNIIKPIKDFAGQSKEVTTP